MYKEGAEAPPSWEKGGSRQFFEGLPPIFDTENTDRVFLRYRYGKYQEIPDSVCNSSKHSPP